MWLTNAWRSKRNNRGRLLPSSDQAKVIKQNYNAVQAKVACFRCSWRLNSFLLRGQPQSAKYSSTEIMWDKGVVHCQLPNYSSLQTVLKGLENRGHRFNVQRGHGEQDIRIAFVPEGTLSNVEKCSQALAKVASGEEDSAGCTLLRQQLAPLLTNYPNFKVQRGIGKDFWYIEPNRPDKPEPTTDPNITDSSYY